VLFDFNKSGLRPIARSSLDEWVARTKAVDIGAVIVVGHTNRLGSKAANQLLSEKRAAVVKAYLVSQGIEASRVRAEGKGSAQPVTRPSDCRGNKPTKALSQCLQPDDRVEIELVGAGASRSASGPAAKPAANRVQCLNRCDQTNKSCWDTANIRRAACTKAVPSQAALCDSLREDATFACDTDRAECKATCSSMP
jgi:stage V sporulation protein SpoVS